MKNYILDTNVLLHDPNSILNFEENTVLIPIDVIEEIDRFKREPSELGQNARSVSRCLDELRAKGRLSEGVPLSTGGRLRIIFHERNQSSLVCFRRNAITPELRHKTTDVARDSPAYDLLFIFGRRPLLLHEVFLLQLKPKKKVL